MNNAQTRLARCFSAVFPGLNGEQIASASVETVEGWDSVASVTLIALVEEEFGIQLQLDAIEHLVSFRAMLDYVNSLADQR
jgi:acyl carrier protein